jgi:hypothetical protein
VEVVLVTVLRVVVRPLSDKMTTTGGMLRRKIALDDPPNIALSSVSRGLHLLRFTVALTNNLHHRRSPTRFVVMFSGKNFL